MNIDLNQIIPLQNLASMPEKIKNQLDETPALVVFHENQPQFALVSLAQLEVLQQGKSARNRASAPASRTLPTTEEPPKIGVFVRSTFERLIRENKITLEEVAQLCDKDYCKAVLRNSRPVLLLRNNQSLDVQRKDRYGHARYYNTEYVIHGKKYLLTNAWEDHPHRAAFLQWLNGR